MAQLKRFALRRGPTIQAKMDVRMLLHFVTKTAFLVRELCIKMSLTADPKQGRS